MLNKDHLHQYKQIKNIKLRHLGFIQNRIEMIQMCNGMDLSSGVILTSEYDCVVNKPDRNR